MYAYVESGGKQYRVAQGERILVDRMEAEPGSEVTLDKVLAVIREDNTVVGSPYVEAASVTARVVSTEKQRKVLVFKQKTRKDHRKLRGHRQSMTTLQITGIQGV
jgi:large subunit ribosomal protein L21